MFGLGFASTNFPRSYSKQKSVSVHKSCVCTMFIVTLLETLPYAKGIRFSCFPSFLATCNDLWQLSALSAILAAKLRDGNLPLCSCIGKQELCVNQH